MSDVVAFVNFPLEDMIKCELCRLQEKGVFRAASRKENYARHLRKKHQVLTENIKVKCSACGRISDKPRLTAWRDTRVHYQKEHPQLLQATHDKTMAEHPLPDKSSIVENVPSYCHLDAQANQDAEKEVEVTVQTRKTVNVAGVIDLSSKTHGAAEKNVLKSCTSLPPAPTIQFNNPVVFNNRTNCITDVPAVENLVAKKLNDGCHSTSKIVAAMGQMFDVVATAVADSQASPIIHSTPEKQTTDDDTTLPAVIQKENFLPHVSRIMPRARPALQRSWKRRLASPTPVSPSKKLQPCVED